MLRYLALTLIRLYQWIVSPVLGPSCRFLPTCSQYAMEAFRIHPAPRAFALTFRRLIKCHPFGPHGCDPVPPAEKGA